MMIFYILISVFIAWIWVDYYRLIDIFHRDKLIYFIITFVLGAGSVYLVLEAQYLFLDDIPFAMNGNPLNDFLFCTFRIGLVEELAKTVPFLIVFLIFRKQFDEPIDFLAIISISALGFSASENVLYFSEYGAKIIHSRAILCTVGHMFFTSLIAYGIIKYRFVNRTKKGFFQIFAYVLCAAVAHGIYDFWLMYEGAALYGWFVTVLFFLLSVSIFSTILNNALNNSKHFTYKKVIDSDKISKRLLTYYGIVFAAQILVIAAEENIFTALVGFVRSAYTACIIVFITVIRLSRFKLIHKRWNKVMIEFPFHINNSSEFTNGVRPSGARFRIKGDHYNEAHLHQYYQEYAVINPVNANSNVLTERRKAYIERKLFLDNDEALFIIRIYRNVQDLHFETYAIKAKTGSTVSVNKKYPVVALMKINIPGNLPDFKLNQSHFSFLEWAYIYPIK